MKSISLLYFRKNSKKVLERARRGERMVMTYRGKPIFRLEPVHESVPMAEDAFYHIGQYAQKASRMTNAQMDKDIYGL